MKIKDLKRREIPWIDNIDDYTYICQHVVDVTIECKNTGEVRELQQFVNRGGWTQFLRVGKIIFSGPCTILIEESGRKTIVRCRNEKYDWKKGAIMVLAKRVLTKYEWNELIDRYRHTPKKETEAFEAVLAMKVGSEVLDDYLKMAKKKAK